MTMTIDELQEKRDKVLAQRDALLSQAFTMDALADYMLDHGVKRFTKDGRELPRAQAKKSLLKTLQSDRTLVKSPELRVTCIPVDPQDLRAGWMCTREEGERRLAIELDRQDRRVKRNYRSVNDRQYA